MVDTTFLDLARYLEGIRCLVYGGIAVAAWGESRDTEGADMAIQGDERSAAALRPR